MDQADGDGADLNIHGEEDEQDELRSSPLAPVLEEPLPWVGLAQRLSTLFTLCAPLFFLYFASYSRYHYGISMLEALLRAFLLSWMGELLPAVATLYYIVRSFTLVLLLFLLLFSCCCSYYYWLLLLLQDTG
ncbi:MAG: hypothetical protein JSS82_13930 [Bacteroidetes bacterium]|nr:hypothetical protein [Bacteroidota bacterium]